MNDPDDVDPKRMLLETGIEITWNNAPPTYVAYQTHKFSVLDAIEQASVILRTDYSAQEESIIIGYEFYRIISTLPHFIAVTAKLLPKVNGRILLGNIGRRTVYLDRDPIVDKVAIVDNGTDRVRILLVNQPPP